MDTDNNKELEDIVLKRITERLNNYIRNDLNQVIDQIIDKAIAEAVINVITNKILKLDKSSLEELVRKGIEIEDIN